MFEPEAVAGQAVAEPKTIKTAIQNVVNKKRSLSLEADGSQTLDTLRAAKGRIKKKETALFVTGKMAKPETAHHLGFMKTF